MIPESRHLLPDEFDEAMLAADRAHAETAQLSEAFASLWARRNPDLASVDADAYRVPSGVALALYRADLKTNRSLPAQSLGREDTSRYWNRLAAAARDVFNAKDWSLLGSLAFRAEQSATVLLRASPSQDNRLAMQVLAAFDRLLEQKSGMSSGNIRVQLLYGYLITIPGSFIVPRELVLPPSTPSGKTDWPILRRVWATGPEDWRTAPHAVTALLKHPSKFVQDLASGWKIVEPNKATAAVVGKDKPGKNPFTGLAQDEGLKRPSAIRVSSVETSPVVSVRQLPKLLAPTLFTDDEMDFEPRTAQRAGVWSRFRNRFLGQKRRTYSRKKK